MLTDKEVIEKYKNEECIILPAKMKVGQEIWVIEPTSRTGLETQLFSNRIMGFSHTGLYYQHYNCPVYFAEYVEVGITVFLDKEEGEKALQMRKKRDS